MSHIFARFVRTARGRTLAHTALLLAALCGVWPTAGSLLPGLHAPPPLAGDNDKGGVGGG